MIPIDAPPLDSIFPTLRETDKARAFLQHLFFIRCKLKTNRKFAPGLSREEGWCPISSTKMQRMLRDYKPIVQKLLDHKIIEVKLNKKGTPSYQENKWTKLYRPVFGIGITNSEQQRYRVEQISHPDVVAAVKRVYIESGYEVKKKVFLESTPWYKKNLEFMERLYIDVSDEELYKKFPEDYHFLVGVKHNFNDGLNRYIGCDDYSGRITSWVSNLSKNLRPFLKHRDGYSLIHIDLKNSQPFMLASLFKYSKQVLKLLPEYMPIERKIREHQSRSDISMFHLDSRVGNIYPRLMQATGLSRDQVKEQLFFHLLFCRPGDYLMDKDKREQRMKFRLLFKSVYPTVFDKIFKLKRTQKGTLPFIYEYSKAMFVVPNRICARLEVILLIEMITKRCAAKGINMGTIHDAFLMNKEDELDFLKIYYDVFSEVGIDAPAYHKDDLQAHDIIKQGGNQ